MDASSIGQAIIRRVSAGKHIVLADYNLEHAERQIRLNEVSLLHFAMKEAHFLCLFLVHQKIDGLAFIAHFAL